MATDTNNTFAGGSAGSEASSSTGGGGLGLASSMVLGAPMSSQGKKALSSAPALPTNSKSKSKSSSASGSTSASSSLCIPATTTNSSSKPKQKALCASCDRCRARKTKCDGKRPCGNCATRYMKKHKLSSIEGVDLALFECVYSPAKRRGPVPGKAGQARKEGMNAAAAAVVAATGSVSGGGGGVGTDGASGGGGAKNSNLMRMDLGMGGFGGVAGVPGGNNMMLQQQQQMAAFGMANMNVNVNGMNMNTTNNKTSGAAGSAPGTGANGENINANDPMAMQRQMLLQQQMLLQGMGGVGMNVNGMDQTGGTGAAAGMNLNQQAMINPLAFSMMQQQLQLQQQQQMLNKMMQQMQGQQQPKGATGDGTNNPASGNASIASMGTGVNGGEYSQGQGPTQRMRIEPNQDSPSINKIVRKHLPLLEKSSTDGNRLRSYYSLSIDVLYKFPPVPSDEEYCAKLNIAMNPMVLPQFDLAALRAARFSEIALGAMVGNQIQLSLELSNAVVACLKQCAEEPVHPSCMYDVARAYFLHGMFRSYRGDMPRYFKYRRVCLAKLSQLAIGTKGVEALLAAISFHDSWAYMVYNANEESLPDIDEVIPPVTTVGRSVSQPQQGQTAEGGMEMLLNAAEKKYQVSTDPSRIASDPKNQMWIQGPPPVFINNEAPPLSRALDALACAIRSCCDQANNRLMDLSKGTDGEESQNMTGGRLSVTSKAVTANEKELCSRNMVLSAFILLQQSEANTPHLEKNYGHHLLVSSMDAFLEGGDEDEAGGFSDSQIQSLLTVCNAVINRPLLLYQPGPTYHMVSNAAIMLCHLLNGIYSKRNKEEIPEKPLGEMESVLFDEVLDTYIALRKILNDHRRKLPLMLRCHGLPRPNLMNCSATGPFIDLGDTLMCASRGCQGFVLMACSPCVAAERAAAAELRHKEEIALFGRDNTQAGEAIKDENDMDTGVDFGELNIDDDALIRVLGKIVAG